MGDLLGAICGHISGKDSRGGTKPLPVYKGKLDVSLKDDKPKGEKTEKQKQMEAYLKKYGGGGDDKGEKKMRRKKKKSKTSQGNVKIIDEEEGCEGVALAKAKGALRMSDEELSDEEAVVVDVAEMERKAEEEKKRSMVQVGDGGDGGSKWVEVDEDGNVIEDASSRDNTGKGDL
eukprot:CAMPEP_0173404264 /NCGR_PEP_ID=MMETSP1356-20130122/58931_1 /TAXON_ID=77927 ORGANISM="Hemiselmis virescens, Strain PCC157" /NCGR_SAMPLE_ID=MMETSP1356 /ASSEMBLY_ACC=CAM_ASM_000847 /LENGTH=174 /DNA_ID=CAMNT_0014364911 /DNA_START=23 /DNA_END=544 /DNA_ORIENTATION=+